ncbi:MAG: dockerin type I repeat-containing protein, partial [Candidatus Zixiibacteriota bacterium]
NFQGPAPAQLYEADLNGDGYIDHGDIAVYSCYFASGMSCFTNGYPVPVCCCPSTDRGACCEVDTCKVRAYQNCQGYYQGDNMPCCTPGDANGSFNFNILDVTYMIAYLYKGGPQPNPYTLCSADANCDCQINILDVTYMIMYLYKLGPEPCTIRQWILSCGCPLRK